jgi:hypothetical protein
MKKVCGKHYQAYEDACPYCQDNQTSFVGSKAVWDLFCDASIATGSLWASCTSSIQNRVGGFRFSVSIDMTYWRKFLEPHDGALGLKLFYGDHSLVLKLPLPSAIPPGQIVTASFPVNLNGTIELQDGLVKDVEFAFEA